MCLHLTAVGRTWPASYPEQQGLAPGQVRCLGCGRVFASDFDWCRAQDWALTGPCPSTYAACPLHDRQCIREAGHVGLHANRAGFAWTDEEAAAVAARSPGHRDRALIRSSVTGEE